MQSNVLDLSGPVTGLPTDALTDDGAEAHVRRFSLRVQDGPDAGAVHVSTGDKVTIGTHPSTTLRLSDRAMSRFHCEIAIEDGAPVIRDLESRNGTWVDGVPVLAAPLRANAVITLGRSRIAFEIMRERVAITLSTNEQFGLAVGQSVAMRALFAMLERVAPTTTPVLLQGETGTGKDVVAESIHMRSPRHDKPFVVVNCAALPPHLIEAELFGYERGAFTGATSSHAGALETANGGTLFLDEIGDLSADMQPKLLRFLEAGEVQRLGSTKHLAVDVRVIAATSRNLRRAVNAQQFRPDLFYRLAVFEVTVPPLRARLEDLPMLVQRLIESLGAAEHPRAQTLLREDELAKLARHRWPGNVRELRNHVERFLVLGDGAPLVADTSDAPVINTRVPLREARQRWLGYFERHYLERLLARVQGNVTKAAREAGVDRIHFHRLLRQTGLR